MFYDFLCISISLWTLFAKANSLCIFLQILIKPCALFPKTKLFKKRVRKERSAGRTIEVSTAKLCAGGTVPDN